MHCINCSSFSGNANVKCDGVISFGESDACVFVSSQLPALIHHFCETEQIEGSVLGKNYICELGFDELIAMFVTDGAGNVSLCVGFCCGSISSGDVNVSLLNVDHCF